MPGLLGLAVVCRKNPEVNPTILFSETGDGSFRSSVLQNRLLAYASRTKQVKRCGTLLHQQFKTQQ
jgi:hypothetical protein